MKTDNKGISLVFVLAALIAVGFIAPALFKMLQSDNVSSSLYSSSESAREAARSGLISAISRFTTNDIDSQRVVLDLLKEYVRAVNPDTLQEQYQWIRGGTNSWYTLSSVQKFRVKITALHPNTYELTLVSEGVGQGGSKATAVGTYSLRNIALDTEISLLPTNALHMGGGGDEFNRAIHVDGGVYINGKGKCYDPNGNLFRFNGPFHLGATAPGDIFRLKAAEFNSTTYLEGRVDLEIGTGGEVEFNGPVGLGYDTIQFNIDSWTNIFNGSLFSNGHIHDRRWTSNTINMNNGGRVRLRNGNIYTDDGSKNNSSDKYDGKQLFSNYTELTYSNSDYDIMDSLGIVPPPEITFNLSQIKPYAITLPVGWSHISGSELNAIFHSTPNKYKDKNGNEWLVINYTGSNGTPFVTDGEGFSERVVWIVESGAVAANSTIYNHEINVTSVNPYRSTGGLSVFYIGEMGTITGLGGANYRGFIYSESSNPNTYKALGNQHFYGAIYQQNGSGKFRIEGGATNAPFYIHYDRSVIEELGDLGVFSESSESSDSLVIDGAKLEAEVLGIAL